LAGQNPALRKSDNMEKQTRIRTTEKRYHTSQDGARRYRQRQGHDAEYISDEYEFYLMRVGDRLAARAWERVDTQLWYGRAVAILLR
jgi:hypothetical protein